ncbi:hypothetical protein PRZ48_011072 [Zasmidium cellare]|uniref:Uncharacterized protein n=1 Tax=Zasmidium cellare TaxID=395010 RepID=A0ABR0EAD6_ZASCE|nr:hypothetical protein PRZ48_011072 [Zasmidium cellare]
MMMETLYSTSGFNSEASLSGLPHTPPYTPARVTKRRLERSDSPASTVGSIHPAETSSPAKKAAKRAATDDIQVEELAEGDMGYMTDLDVVYPEELEEISSSDSDEDQDATDVSENEASHLTRKLSRLRCGDDQEVDFEQLRRQRHIEKRAGTRIFKRTHSQSVKSETDVTDADALDDHDLGSSQRRLRRRVRGPREAGVAFEDLLRSSPEASNASAATDGIHPQRNATDGAESDGMDVDDAK